MIFQKEMCINSLFEVKLIKQLNILDLDFVTLLIRQMGNKS